MLLQQGEEFRSVYLIKEGEVELQNYLDNDEIDDIVLQDWQRLDEKIDIMEVMHKRYPRRTTLAQQQITLLGAGECVGYENALGREQRARFTARVSSTFLIAYVVSQSIFSDQFQFEEQVHRRMR